MKVGCILQLKLIPATKLAKKSAHMLMMLLPGGGEIGTAICVEDGSYCAGDGNDSR